MNNPIEKITVNELLPSSVSYDKTIAALSKVLGDELMVITNSIEEILFYPNIRRLPEPIIDLLAEQFQVSFYSVLGLDLDTKKTLVENSIMWNKRRGTKAVMEEMLGLLYNSQCVIQEWFEFGGEPYTFRLYMDNLPFNQGDFNNIMDIIYMLKNVRSHLELITKSYDFKRNISLGVAIARTVNSTLPIKKKGDHNFTTNLLRRYVIYHSNNVTLPILG